MNPTDILEHHIKQRRGELSFSASKPKAVKQWANKLLELPLGDACLQLWQALKEIHELDCDENLRFELLQSVVPVVQHLAQELYAITSKSRQVQYNDRHEQVLQLLLGIYAFLLLSYYDIVQRIDEQWQNHIASWQVIARFKTKTTLIKASFWGLKVASILLHYQVLFDIPVFKKQWYLIHQIYDLSQKNKQHLVQLSIFLHHKENTYNVCHIEQQYKQILLFELLSATHLSEADLASIFTYTHDWARHVQFMPVDEQNAFYRIAMGQDIPIYFAHQSKYQQVQADIAVSTTELTQFFENEMMSNSQFMGSSTLRLYIHHVLTNGYKRRDERFSYVAELDAYLGLPDMLGVLSQRERSQEYVARHNLHLYTLQILDKSKSGYKIRWQDDIPLLVQKGNLLLIKEKSDDGRMYMWQIAVIRWVQKVDKTAVEIGVEIICRQQFIVQLENQMHMTERAILTYVRHPAKGEQYALILPKKSQLYKDRVLKLKILQADVEIPIKLGQDNHIPESHYVQKYDIKLQKPEDNDMLYRILTQSTLS